MEISLANRLKKKAHLEVAMLQDEVVEVIYASFGELEPVLHGGTAIWRCYNGNRFSEDLDFYAKTNGDFKDKWIAEMNKRSLTVLKFKQTENTIFAKVSNGEAEVRLEMAKRKPGKEVIAAYEKANGAKMNIYTLTAEELIVEKMNAYKSRRLIRDIYDVYHLSNLVKGKSREMQEFLRDLPTPTDEENLKAIIYAGIVPTFKQMAETLQARV